MTTNVSTEQWAGGPSADVRPSTSQLTARLEGGAWVLERMRWGLIRFWRGGKPVKHSAKGVGDGLKMTTFNARIEGVERSRCSTLPVFKAAFLRGAAAFGRPGALHSGHSGSSSAAGTDV